MNKMVTKVFAVTTGAAMFAGMFAAGIGATAKQADAYNTSTAAGWGNLMGVLTDNATNVQVFKTDYGYGAWATDSNGNIIGDEPIAKTAYYLADSKLNAKKDTDYGDFVAAYEVNLFNTSASFGIPGGNTIQTYYDVADFATNVTDHYDHFANGLPIWENAYTASASLDANGGTKSPYIFGFEFGDYNPNYVEFVGTTWNVKNYNTDKKFVDNTQIGVWTNTKLPDFSAGLDYYRYQKDANGNIVKDAKGNPVVLTYVPEVYPNPVFEDAWSLATSRAEAYGTAPEDILVGQANTWKWDKEKQQFVVDKTYDIPGQIMPPADEYGDYWGDIEGSPAGSDWLGSNGSLNDFFQPIFAQ